MAELERLSDKVNISSLIKEKAAVIYREALAKALIRRGSIVSIAAAALYVACRKSGIPITISEMARASLVDKKDVTRCYRMLLQELDFQMPITDPLIFVSKIAEKNGISGKTQGAAIAILREVKQKRFAAGKDPIGMAASALYIACLQNNEKITQKNIAEAAGVTEVTVRNRCKALKKQLNLKTLN
jgi:transcription initiation factor TFIIB